MASTDVPVRLGYALAGLDPASSGRREPQPRLHGSVQTIAVAGEATSPMREVEDARAIADRGLAGDRYAKKAGTFTPKDGGPGGYDLTLIEAEVLDELRLADGRRLEHIDARRNLVTRGIDLNALVGRRFRVGDVECVGRRLCEPCSHLEKLTVKGVLRELIHHGGLRADVVGNGTISRGATIETID
jgi:MOSC domain-containing protein YiiM